MRTKALIAALAAAALASSAHAAILDLTQSFTTATLNGAIFETSDIHTSGTGAIDPFVRLQHNGFEQGYNTSANHLPFDEKPGTWTHDLLLSAVPIRNVTLGSALGDIVVAYEFLLDVNQTTNNNTQYLSLDKVQIYTSPTPSQNTTNVASLGTLRYDLDAGEDSWVRLDPDLSTGSGGADMRLYVPASLFAGAENEYVYLYSAFGTNYATSGGFEEWAVQSVIPSPGPVALAGLGGLLITRRKR